MTNDVRSVAIPARTKPAQYLAGITAELATPPAAVSAVTAGWVGSTPRLYVPVDNPGQTFVKATGTVSCQRAGRAAHSYRVIMETVLPSGGAVLPVNAPGPGPSPWRPRPTR